MSSKGTDVAPFAEQAGPVLIAGPLTVDHFTDGSRPGGAVRYAARVASAFGLRAQLLVNAAPDADRAALEGHHVHLIESPHTLAYEHRFDERGEREMRLVQSPGLMLTPAHIPSTWPQPRTLVLAPLLPDDLDVPAFVARTRVHEIALLAQGMQRRVDDHGYVRHLDHPAASLLQSVDQRVSVFLSDEEVRDWPPASLDALVHSTRRVVVTQGREGADVHTVSGVTRIEGRPVTYVDPTGAGDVFATALILAVRAGERVAGEIASAYAAASIERRGPAPLPSLHEIEALTKGSR